MKTVLIVDDDESMRKIMSRRIAQWGYSVATAADGAEAIQRAGAQPPPDIVLLDIMMPGLDGLEVCRRLTQGASTRNIPVILISAKASQVSGEQVAAAGAFASLQKPYDPSDLQRRIAEAIAKKEKQQS